MQIEILFVGVDPLAAFVYGAFGFGFPLLATPLLAFGFISQRAFHLEVISLTAFNLPLILGARWLGIRMRRRGDMDTSAGMLRVALWVTSVGILIDALRRLT